MHEEPVNTGFGSPWGRKNAPDDPGMIATYISQRDLKQPAWVECLSAIAGSFTATRIMHRCSMEFRATFRRTLAASR